MFPKVLVLLSLGFVLATLILAQKPNRGKQSCDAENLNTTCAEICEMHECIKGACICSTQVYQEVILRPPNRACRKLANQRRKKEKSNLCFPDEDNRKAYFCCLYPRNTKPTAEPPESEIDPVDPEDTAPVTEDTEDSIAEISTDADFFLNQQEL